MIANIVTVMADLFHFKIPVKIQKWKLTIAGLCITSLVVIVGTITFSSILFLHSFVSFIFSGSTTTVSRT